MRSERTPPTVINRVNKASAHCASVGTGVAADRLGPRVTGPQLASAATC
jgi:hypothetical protein